MTQDATIIFEQPLNEYIRVCLRLEHLFAQVEHYLSGKNAIDCRVALNAILEALNVMDRPDLKSKITKALTQHAAALTHLEEQANIDQQKLRAVLDELDALIDSLHKSQDKMGHVLRDNSFLSTIRQHMANPGGASPFSTPAYYLWLHKSPERRSNDLHAWYEEFMQIRQGVKLLLQLTRGSSHPQPCLAYQGFYQQALDPRLSYHLLRVAVPLEAGVYPEISVGKHRLSVRFMELNTQDRAIQSSKDIAFDLTCCLVLAGINER